MAAVDTRPGTRRRAGFDPRAAKEKRQKLFLLFAAPVLGLLLFIQVPKFLGGDEAEPAPSAAVTAPAPVAPAAPGAATPAPTPAATPPPAAKPNGALRGFSPKDPFVQQVRASDGSGASNARPAPAPARRRPVASPRTGRTRYVVVLASIRASRARGSLARGVERARAAGVRRVGILNSSRYVGLRPGYYIVSGGTYASSAEARRAMRQARARGFSRAYTRRVRS